MNVRRIGIRELRNNLKDYLEQVEQGVSIEITKNGRTIGMLVPRRDDDDAVDRLIAQGKLLAPTSGSYAVRLPRRVQPSSGPTATEILDELRGTS